MTVKMLYNMCKGAINDGYGDNDIILCVNGNEFYALEKGFSLPVQNNSLIYDFIDGWNASEDESIVLN